MKILVISHDAYRAGATLLLLELLRWWRKTASADFEVLVRNPLTGELLPDFRDLAPTHLWEGSAEALANRGFDRVYSNTITNGEVLDALAGLGLPVLTHVHELAYWIDKCGPRNLKLVKKHTRRYIAASRAVRDHLAGSRGIPEGLIDVVPEYVDVEEIRASQRRGELKRALGLEAEASIVAACGAESWRKGKDLFVPVAGQVLRKAAGNVHFVWIGGSVSKEIADDHERSPYRDRIHFVPHLPDARRLFGDVDVFLMLSRDDPFPVVNLEMGALGRPIVCFADAGGTPELLGQGGGFVVPFLDVAKMSERTLELLADRDLAGRLGRQLAERVERECRTAVCAARITDALNGIV